MGYSYSLQLRGSNLFYSSDDGVYVLRLPDGYSEKTPKLANHLNVHRNQSEGPIQVAIDAALVQPDLRKKHQTSSKLGGSSPNSPSSIGTETNSDGGGSIQLMEIKQLGSSSTAATPPTEQPIQANSRGKPVEPTEPTDQYEPEPEKELDTMEPEFQEPVEPTEPTTEPTTEPPRHTEPTEPMDVPGPVELMQPVELVWTWRKFNDLG